MWPSVYVAKIAKNIGRKLSQRLLPVKVIFAHFGSNSCQPHIPYTSIEANEEVSLDGSLLKR
jgi:hypothetical protein